jgi:hypothetical protein
VETGPGAEKLQALKEQLTKRHTVSFFTTPEDLQARIMNDVPSQLAQMGVEVTDELANAEEIGDRDVLKHFEMLPKLFAGRQITIEFTMGALRSAFTEDCVALHLEPGATVATHVTIDSGQTFYVYGERDIALALHSLPKGSSVRAVANTAFGTCTQVLWTGEGIPETRAETGLVITRIWGTDPPRPNNVDLLENHGGSSAVSSWAITAHSGGKSICTASITLRSGARCGWPEITLALWASNEAGRSR